MIKQIWSQRLFGRLLTQIEKRKLEIKTVCDKLDVNNTGKLEPKEL